MKCWCCDLDSDECQYEIETVYIYTIRDPYESSTDRTYEDDL